MAKAKKIEPVTEDKGFVGGEVKIVVDEVKPKSDKEKKKLAAIVVKNEKKNAERAFNKAKEAEKKTTKKESNAKKTEIEKLSNETNPMAGKKKNKSQVASEVIIKEADERGFKLSEEDVRLVKSERKIREKIVHPAEALHYFKTIEQRIGSKATYIILITDVVPLIQAKCPMPVNSTAYLKKAKILLKAQVDDTFGFFLVPFPGLATFTTHIGDLATAIQNFIDDDGTGNTETIEAAVKLVQVSVDALLVYVNGICRGNQVEALAIIAAAKMQVVKQREKGKKKDFGIKLGAASGSVILTSLAGKVGKNRVPTTYYWQYGLMVGTELIWYNLPDTTDECSTTATGMPINVTVAFRKRTKSKRGGLSDWCTPLYISPK